MKYIEIGENLKQHKLENSILAHSRHVEQFREI